MVFGIVMVMGSLVLIPMTARAMRAMQEPPAQPSNPSVFDGLSIPVQTNAPEPLLSAGFLATYLSVTFGLAVVLYAAAVVRRLHDRGMSGAWGLMPLPFYLFTSVQMTRMLDPMMRGEQPDTAMFLSAAMSSMLYWVALGALVVLLAGAGDAEPNRYDLGAT